MHAIAAGDEHGERRRDRLGLEITVEAVGEEHDLATVLGADRIGRRAKEIGAPDGEGALRPRNRRRLATESAAPGTRSLRFMRKAKARRDRRVARQGTDEPIEEAKTLAFRARGIDLDLHARHVDAGRAFALARLAGDAKLERLRHLVGGERLLAERAGKREPQACWRVRASHAARRA